ncbi:MAG: DUF6488 family protein [Sphingomicrobium sp.]
MRKLMMFAALATLGLAAPALAHPEDEGTSIPRGPSTAELAQEAINKLVTQRKLPASWTKAKMLKFDYREKNGGQYVLIYQNAAIKQAAKRKLYVVMTTDGKFVSAGHKLS